MPIATAMRRHGVSQTQLYRILRQTNTPRRDPRKGRIRSRLSASDEDAMARAYERGGSKNALAIRFNCSPTRVGRVLRDAGVALRDPLDSHTRRYPLRHDAFRDITPTSAYWAGLVMADGCVSRGNTVEVALQRSDAGHLTAFHDFLGCPRRPITIRDNIAISRVHSKRLVSDLVARGIVPRKSYGATADDALAARPSFWLGMIDGDGSIFVARGPTVTLCGSRSLMEQFQSFLADHVLGRRPRIQTRKPDGLCSVRVEGRPAQAVLEVLYRDSPISLPRKREAAQRALAWECARPRDRVFSGSETVAWSEKRRAWSGESTPRRWHAARLAEVAAAVLRDRDFKEIRRCRPSSRSSTVVFSAIHDDEPVLVWVTSRWKAAIPRTLAESPARDQLFVLHVSPRDASKSVISRARGAHSCVSIERLRELARRDRSPIDPTTVRRALAA